MVKLIPNNTLIAIQELKDVESKPEPIIVQPYAPAPSYIVAIIKAVGPGRLLDDGSRVPIPVKEGDKIIVPRNLGAVVNWLGNEFILIRQEDILATLVMD
jgi:chaperonin GroES